VLVRERQEVQEVSRRIDGRPRGSRVTEIDESLLLRQFLDWVAARPRSYADTVEAWRSSCPRHPVLDDAFTAGLIASVGKRVILTTRGEALLGSDP
jgi:hypothetical protein